MRATPAIHWLPNGATPRDIRLLLGHKSVATTQKYFGATVSEKLKEYLNDGQMSGEADTQ
jgi:site-specific recombinase XerD